MHTHVCGDEECKWTIKKDILVYCYYLKIFAKTTKMQHSQTQIHHMFVSQSKQIIIIIFKNNILETIFAYKVMGGSDE